MNVLSVALAVGVASLGAAFAQEVVYRESLTEQSVEARDVSIQLRSSRDEVHFLIVLRNKVTGAMDESG